MVVAVMGVIASYGVAGPVSLAHAGTVSGSQFQIDTDANLVVDPAGPGNLDWLDGTSLRAGVLHDVDIPSGTSDNSFGQGTHESTAVPTVVTGSIPPNKSDLKSFGVYKETQGTDHFLNVFWTRVQDPSGDTNMDFEFNKSSVLSANGVTPVRSEGDLLVTYDLSNGGQKASISKRTWVSGAWDGATVFTDAQALGSINSSPILAANADGVGALSPRTFGEASMNMDALVGTSQDACTTFGSVYVKSRSSDSFSSELKDFIAPQAAPFSNCGTVLIHKTDPNGAQLAGAVFTLSNSQHSYTCTSLAQATATLAVGDCWIPNVVPGTYTLHESTPPAGHNAAPDQQVVISGADDNEVLTISDPIQRGTLTIVKDALPNDPQDFTFSVDSGADGATLDDDADPTRSNTASFSLLPGSHTVTETNIPSNWVNTALTCSGQQSTSLATSTATVTIVAGQTVTCTYTDTKRKANLTISKTASAAFGRHYSWSINKRVDQTRVEMADGDTATFHYSVDVSSTFVDSAWTVTGNITVHNSNDVAFTGVDVTDTTGQGGTCVVPNGSNQTVAAGGDLVLGYTCTYTSAPTDPVSDTATATWNAATYLTTAGSATNTAAASFGNLPTSTTDQVVTVNDSVQGPLGTWNAADGASHTFTYTVTRRGVAGTCTTYDNRATFTTNSSATTGHDDQSVAVCVGVNPTVSKNVTATFHRSHLWSLSKTVDQTRVNMAAGGTAVFHYTVTATPTGVSDSAYAMSGTIHLSNPNDWESLTVNLSDTPAVGGGAVCTPAQSSVLLAPSGSADVAYTCSFTGSPGNGTNTAGISWTGGHTPSSSAASQVPVTFAVVGTQTNATVTVVDDKTDPQHPVTLGTANASAGPAVFTYDVSKQGVAGACTNYTNTASIQETGQSATQTVTVCVGSDLSVTKTALATDHATFLWNLSKNVDRTSVAMAPGGSAAFTYTVTATPAGQTADGWSVTGQITVSNPNSWEDVPVSVSDVLSTGGGGSCSINGGGAVVVPHATAGGPGTAILNYTCTFASQPSNGTNTATATWDSRVASTPHGSASGNAAVVFVPTSETNRTITVVDDKTDPNNPVTLGQATWGATATSFTYSLVKGGTPGTCVPYTNTAVILQTQQSARQTVQVCQGAALITSATATASLDRTFDWAINKAVDQTTITVPDGTVGTFNYTVTVTPSGIVDGGYTLGGAVTVSNPNTWEAIVTNVGVVADVGGGVACVVTNGTGQSVPAGGSVTLPFTCGFTGAPVLTGTLTATSTWDAVAAGTSAGSSVGTSNVDFAVASETNREITVVDDKTDPANPVELGTWRYDDGEHAFTYSVLQAGAPDVCTDYTNVATIVQTQQSDTQLATLCEVFTGGGGTVTPPTGGGGLPFTGDALGLLARVAISLLAAGLALLAISRKRRTVE